MTTTESVQWLSSCDRMNVPFTGVQFSKDNTLGCTAEACSFRDSYEVFKEARAEVISVSSDSAESHQQFASQHRLPFILLSDRDGATRKLYGVPTTLGLLPGRVTYVIDKGGIVRHIFSSQLAPPGISTKP
ncbi:MAG: peroxiredoxin [Ktedonobacteraceae bacterium]|nr:peroxiredoxin [Ktedonobacteraceae bacterium]